MPPTTQPIRHLISAAPRSHLFTFTRTLPALQHQHQHQQQRLTRNLTTTPRTHQKPPSSSSSSSQPQFSPFTTPSPPSLPKEEQEIFETLQRQSTGAFSTPRSLPQINQSPDSSISDRAEAASVIETRTENLSSGGDGTSKFKEVYDKVIEARGKGEELHPNVRRGATPEFEGEVNPKTGEVGGPKNEPLRWGAAGEWSYNGRTTDF